MNADAGLREQLQDMLAKADRSLHAAREHLTKGDHDFAVSRAYYAVFYCLEATLLTRGLVFSRHGGVIAGFNQHFVKTGIFPRDFSERIARLFRQRQIGDYRFTVSISLEEASEVVRDAHALTVSIADHLRQQKFVG